MPEVAEVAHACALLRRNVIGLKVRRAALPLDNLLFPALKTADNPSDVIQRAEKQLLGATVRSSGRHGKYFWLRFETTLGSPLVMLMHFGMTGRIRLRDVHSHMIFMENGGDKKVLEQKSKEKVAILAEHVKEEDSATGDANVRDIDSGYERDNGKETEKSEEWPPKFTKFELFLSNDDTADERSIELAFSDPRRLARVRFLAGEEYSTDFQLLSLPPLESLGPDYSKQGSETSSEKNAVKIEESDRFEGDPDPSHHGRPRLSFEDFGALVLTKKKPIKAFLLDQDFFAGIGNWVSDEILYHARIHPSEVISKKILDPGHPVLRKLYDSIVFVMEESVRAEGNARLFPEDWLMLHRWGKGRKQPKAKTSSGHVVDFETVGGRTSCFVPELQKPLKNEAKEAKKAESNAVNAPVLKVEGNVGDEIPPMVTEKAAFKKTNGDEEIITRSARSSRSKTKGKVEEVEVVEKVVNKRRRRN